MIHLRGLFVVAVYLILIAFCFLLFLAVTIWRGVKGMILRTR